LTDKLETAAGSSCPTFLFTDIEGSTRLWEIEPQRMSVALARHDASARAAIEHYRGRIIKVTGDGVHAVFDDPSDALLAVLRLQHELAAAPAAGDLALHVRCGLHLGADEQRGGDYFGPVVNRAARIMDVAYGGQILLSEAVADRIGDRLPPDVSLRNLGTVRLRDLEHPERIFQVVDPRLRTEFPSLQPLKPAPNNLPQQLNSFVGRKREIAALRERLRDGRLLTLLGIGGIGKSRLSLQLAEQVLDDYPDGVWLVELAALRDASRVVSEIGAVLGVRESGGQPMIEAVAEFLRERKVLIVLDNCEHLLEACAVAVKSILQRSTWVRFIATSRGYLGIAGEQSFQVPTLAAPDLAAAIEPDALIELDAVRLFVDRVAAAKPGFKLGAGNAAAIARICSRLDGIPLAIELAAARTRTLSIETIAERLGDRFRLLANADRTVPERQRTLQALIDWSHDLLGPKERCLFQRLAVFDGGWTLEAAEAVCQGAPVDPDEIVELLGHLVEQSLVIMDADGTRYRMLDTVRHYAHAKLVNEGSDVAVRARHRDTYVALAESALPELKGPDQGAWFARLDLERENFLAAHAFGNRADQPPEPGVRLIDALCMYWINRGLPILGLRVTEETLARPSLAHRALPRCRALLCAGQLCFVMGRYSESIDHFAEGLSIAEEIDDSRQVAFFLQQLGLACLGEGALPAARQHLREALALAEQMGDKREIAGAASHLAMVHRLEGHAERAEPLYRSALALARQLGDHETTAIADLNLALVSIDLGGRDAAQPLLVEALEIIDRIGARRLAQCAIEICSAFASAKGDWGTCARLFGSAKEQARRMSMQPDPADEASLAIWFAQARAALGDVEFARLSTAAERLTLEEGLLEARAWLDGLSRQFGRVHVS